MKYKQMVDNLVTHYGSMRQTAYKVGLGYMTLHDIQTGKTSEENITNRVSSTIKAAHAKIQRRVG